MLELLQVAYLESQPVHNVAYTPKLLVLIARPSIEVNPNTSKWPGKGLSRYSDSVREGGDLVEFGGVLKVSQYLVYGYGLAEQGAANLLT